MNGVQVAARLERKLEGLVVLRHLILIVVNLSIFISYLLLQHLNFVQQQLLLMQLLLARLVGRELRCLNCHFQLCFQTLFQTLKCVYLSRLLIYLLFECSDPLFLLRDESLFLLVIYLGQLCLFFVYFKISLLLIDPFLQNLVFLNHLGLLLSQLLQRQLNLSLGLPEGVNLLLESLLVLLRVTLRDLQLLILRVLNLIKLKLFLVHLVAGPLELLLPLLELTICTVQVTFEFGSFLVQVLDQSLVFGLNVFDYLLVLL